LATLGNAFETATTLITFYEIVDNQERTRDNHAPALCVLPVELSQGRGVPLLF